MRCPECGCENNQGDKFCSFCGTPLIEFKNTSFTNSGNQMGNSPSSSSEKSGSSSKSTISSLSVVPSQVNLPPSNSKKWFIWLSILVVGIILGSGIFWFTNLSSKNNPISSSEIKSIALKEESLASHSNYFLHSSQTISSQGSSLQATYNQNSRDLESIQFSQNKAPSEKENSKFLMIDTVSEPLIAINYSGPSCAVMALSAQNVFASQSVLGQQLGLTEGKVSDYRDLRDLMNQYLSNNDSNVRYTGYYYLLDYTTVQEQKDAFETFLNRVDSDLNQGKVPLVVVGKSPDGTLQRNSYAIITGKSMSGMEYRIKIPYLTETKEYLVDLQTLLDIVYAPEALCYLY